MIFVQPPVSPHDQRTLEALKTTEVEVVCPPGGVYGRDPVREMKRLMRVRALVRFDELAQEADQPVSGVYLL